MSVSSIVSDGALNSFRKSGYLRFPSKVSFRVFSEWVRWRPGVVGLFRAIDEKGKNISN